MSPWVTNLPNRPEQPRVVIIFELFIKLYYNNIVINRGMHNPADYHVPPFLKKRKYKKLLFWGGRSPAFFSYVGGGKKQLGMKEGKMKNYQFNIPGKPQGKQRPRTTRNGHIYTPKQTKEYEQNVVDAFLETNPEATLITNPCKITITAKFEIPKSYSRKKIQEAIRKNYYTGKPDTDNIVKIIMDGLNGIAYEDDKLIVEIHAVKKYTLADPGVTVKIEEIEPYDPEEME